MQNFLKKSKLSILQKNIALKTFYGYKEADKIIMKERMNDLSSLTVKKGIERFNEICRLHEITHKKDDFKTLDKMRIKDACTLRKRLDLMGKKIMKGNKK